MRSLIGPLLVLIMICSESAFAGRSILPLDGEWILDVPGKASSLKIKVPGTWQSQFRQLRDFAGRAIYSRSVIIPGNFSGKRIFICFGAVDYYAEVFVN